MRVILAAMLMAITCGSASAKPLESPYQLCAELDALPLTERCSVHAQRFAVDAVTNIDFSLALQLCTKIPRWMRESGTVFPVGWNLQIFRTARDGKPLVKCPLNP